MDESIPAGLAAELARADRAAYLEQRLFVLSPFGTFVTAALVFALLAGSYAIVALASGTALLEPDQAFPAPQTRLALWFALLTAMILGMQRYSRNRERADFAQWSRILAGGAANAARVTGLTPGAMRLPLFTAMGAILGAASTWFLFRGDHLSLPVLLWFGMATILVTVLFARGIELTRGGGRDARRMIDSEIKIDLLRIDSLSVVGRSSARTAIIWFAISAVVLLQFISGDLSPVTILLLVVCAVMGVWIFVRTMDHVHRKIREAKARELERVRGEIDLARAGASPNLQSLLAYEARIMAAPEWPFDQTTAMRVAASALIVTVPWFGQAVAGYFVEHLAHG